MCYSHMIWLWYLACSSYGAPLLSEAVHSHRWRGTDDLIALFCIAVNTRHYNTLKTKKVFIIYQLLNNHISQPCGRTFSSYLSGYIFAVITRCLRLYIICSFWFTREGRRVISSLHTGAGAACVCCRGSPGLWPWRRCRRTDREPSRLHGSLYPEDCLRTPEEQNTEAVLYVPVCAAQQNNSLQTPSIALPKIILVQRSDLITCKPQSWWKETAVCPCGAEIVFTFLDLHVYQKKNMSK